MAVSAWGAAPAGAASHDNHLGLSPGKGDLSAPSLKVPEGREVPELATAKSRTWVTDNGAYTTRVFSKAINVRGEDKKYKAIDNRLKADGDVFVNGEGNFDLELPKTLADPVKLTDGDAWVSLELRGASAPAAVDGSSATYAGAADGVDAKFTAFNEAVKEDLVLKSADAETSFSYELKTSPGLQAKARPDGGVDIVDARGETAFAIPAAVAVDAKGAVAPEGAAKIAIDGEALTISLDPEWIKAEGRAFPVVLDPSVTTAAAKDCFTDEIDPNTSYCGSGELWAGRESAGHNHQALASYNLAGIVPQAAFVQEAHAHYYPLYQTNAGAPAKTLHARRVTSDWDNAATWTKRTAAANWGTPGGDLASASEDQRPVPASGQWSEFTLTNLVNSWLDGSVPNQGVAIGDNGSTTNNTVVYASTDWADSNAWPYLEVEYFPRAGQMAKYTFDSQSISDRSSVGVNVANGNLMVTSSDLKVAAKGLPISISRYFNSQDVWDGQMGFRGRLSLGRDIALYECDSQGSRCLVGPSGFRARFPKKADGSFDTPPNVGNLTLKRDTPTSGRFTLTDNGSGTKYGFFDNGYSFADQITDRHGNQINFQFWGPYGSLSKITDANGRDYPVTANSDGLITKIEVPSAQFPGGVAWNYGYNANGDLTSVTDPEGKVTTYTYTSGSLTKITDPRANDILITYDAQDRVTSVTRKVDGTTANDVKTTYAYPAVDSKCDLGADEGGLTKIAGKTEVTNANNQKTTYCWDQGGGVRKAINAKNQETDTKFAASTGNVEKFTNFAGTSGANVATALTYDASQGKGYNLTGSKSPAGEESSATYKTPSATDPLEQYRIETSKDSQGKSAKYTYTNGDVTNIKNTDGPGAGTKSVDLNWNPDGTLNYSKDANLNQTSYTYDSLGRLSEVRPPDFLVKGKVTLTYDGLSRLATSTDPRGKVTTMTYDKLDRQKSVTDADGVVHSMTYDNSGNLTGRTGPSQTSSYTWDKLGRKTAETIIGTTNTYAYDKIGNLTSLTDAGAPGAVTYEYDEINRVSKITAPPASGTVKDVTTYAYVDPAKATIATDPTVKGYVTQTLNGQGTIRTTQNISGKTTEVLVKTGAGTQTLKRTYEYTARTGTGPKPQRDLLQWSTEQSGASDPVTNKTYTYDDSGQILAAETQDAAFNPVSSDAFDYDGAGNRKHRVRSAGSTTSTTSYAYDTRNQLCWTAPTNVATPSCASPAGGSTGYTFDNAGNQLTGATTATWDAKSKLKTIAGASVTALAPNNNELVAVGTSTYRNTVLGVSRLTVGGNTSIIYRNADNGGAVSQLRDSAARWFVQDQIGSTIALVDTTGAVKRTYEYDVDGNATTPSSTQPETWIKYAGGHDVGNGLYHFGARYYQPSIGRWTQQDPLSQPSDLQEGNRYAYVGNNSINGTDPSGMCIILKCKTWNGSAAGRIAKRTLEGAAQGAVDGVTVAAYSGFVNAPAVIGASVAEGAGEGAITGAAYEVDRDAGELAEKAFDVKSKISVAGGSAKGAYKYLK